MAIETFRRGSHATHIGSLAGPTTHDMESASLRDELEIPSRFLRDAASLDHSDLETVAAGLTADAVLESPVTGCV